MASTTMTAPTTPPSLAKAEAMAMNTASTTPLSMTPSTVTTTSFVATTSNVNNSSITPTTTNITNTATTPTTTTTTPSSSSSSFLQRGRTYRMSTTAGATNKWVTREIAALDFLLNIPMQNENSIVHQGWIMQQQQDQQQVFDHDTSNIQLRSDNNDENDDEAKRPEDDMAALEPPPASSHGGRWWEKLLAGAGGGGGGVLGSVDAAPSSNNNRRGTTASLSETTILDGTDGPNQIALAAGTVEDALQQGLLLAPPPPPLSQSVQDPTTPIPATTNTGKNSNKDEVQQQVVPLSVPSRRLDGDLAYLVQIPLTVDTMTRQRSIARQAIIREWEQKVAYGLIHTTSNNNNNKNPQHQPQQQPPMLDGRMFFSASGSYPVGVYSVLRYEPKKEEEARLRQKLEARGGGGTEFAVPERDWRGTTYRNLLPQRRTTSTTTTCHRSSSFHRFLQQEQKKKKKLTLKSSNSKKENVDDDDDDENDYEKDSDDDSVSSTSSSELSDTYVPGFLDDPEMVQGRHRNLMIGDRNTGCIIVSTIQFVEPALLKADLNKQFRERFESWEPPKSQRKYIGARVVDGVYTLMDTEEQQSPPQPQPNHAEGTTTVGSGNSSGGGGMLLPGSILDRSSRRTRQSSVTHVGTGCSVFEERDFFRMPPSLTLSKIRSVKQQALLAAVKAKLEISTVALACIYFERLCLDCRVDKTNRRLCFASCLLLSMKINEAYVGLVTPSGNNHNNDSGGGGGGTRDDAKKSGLHSLIRTTNKSQTMFASLLEFFTQDWQLSLKQLFAAEWGVFAALGFSLHAKPSHVAFHFKRLMKTLEWNIHTYLGREMYSQWQDVLEEEDARRRSRERRREIRRKRKEQNLIALQRELQVEAERRERRTGDKHQHGWNNLADDPNSQVEEPASPTPQPAPSDLPSPSTDTLSSTTHHHKTGRIKLFNRLSIKRSASQGKLQAQSHDAPPPPPQPISTMEISSRRKRLSLSPSMPLFMTSQPPHASPHGSYHHASIEVNSGEESALVMSEDDSDAGIIV